MGAVLLVNLEPDTAEQLFALSPVAEVRSVHDPQKVRQELVVRSRTVDLLVLRRRGRPDSRRRRCAGRRRGPVHRDSR